ncbi:hypothetical protein CLF_105075 [Clonorchis sinensis]|uniref:Reverse transcriptase domain-containing protein n=1 Tax=Clonorchis sinensis TaxID=79923 RepID=G7YCY1_CLOSI|nr:hypothetical protein CLF_105075 [Clonorchis sinensis]
MVVTRLLASLVLCRHTLVHKMMTLEQPVGFWPGKSYTVYYPFLFNFVIDEVMRRTLEGLHKSGVQVTSDDNLEYANDALVIEEKMQVSLDELIKINTSFGTRFEPTECKVTLLDMQSLNTARTTQEEALEVVEFAVVAVLV